MRISYAAVGEIDRASDCPCEGAARVCYYVAGGMNKGGPRLVSLHTALPLTATEWESALCSPDSAAPKILISPATLLDSVINIFQPTIATVYVKAVADKSPRPLPETTVQALTINVPPQWNDSDNCRSRLLWSRGKVYLLMDSTPSRQPLSGFIRVDCVIYNSSFVQASKTGAPRAAKGKNPCPLLGGVRGCYQIVAPARNDV